MPTVTAPEPPPAVVFSTPVPDETDVEAGTVVRDPVLARHGCAVVQGSHPRSYRRAAGVPADPAPAPPVFTYNYNVGTRGIELKFTKPLERFQTRHDRLLEGITAIGGDPLRPWTLTFTTRRVMGPDLGRLSLTP